MHKPTLPGCLSNSALISALVIVIIYAGITLLRGGILFSPGALNAQSGSLSLGGVTSHAAIQDCARCHPAPFSDQTMSDRCLACHTDLKTDANNCHNIMTAQGEKSGCTTCHTDHRGPNASLTRLDPQNFPHDKLSFSLNAHPKMADGSTFQCMGCHPNGYSSFDPAVCGSCHSIINGSFTQNHMTSFGQNCLACHDGIDSYGHAFNHTRVAFALTGKHITVACGQCHTPNAATTLAALKNTSQDCASCHAKDDAHQGDLGLNCGQCHTPDGWTPATIDHNLTAFKLVGKHTTVDCAACHANRVFKGTPQECFACHAKDDGHQGDLGQNCGQCHTSDGWTPATMDHNLTRFPLIGKHQTADCATCHVNGVFKGTPQDCFACHAKDDSHQGDLGQKCGQCHTPTGWLPATMDHNLTSFPLVGKHVGVDCATCHVNHIFKGTPQACYACHAKDDAHKGQLGQDCGLCHTPAGWIPSTFDHNKSIFPLTGAHLRVPCTSCHVKGAGGIVFKGTPTTCAGCHADPAYHAGLFGFNCAGCHTTSAWVPAKFNGPHAFPINHGGAGGTCRNCHPATLKQYTCFKCHNQAEMVSRHANEGINNISNCVGCHATGGGGN